MKTINFKVVLASVMFAGAVITSCKDNKNASEPKSSDQETMQNEGSINGEGSMDSGASGQAMPTDTTATNNQEDSGAGAQPTVPGGTATGSGTGGNSNPRP